MHPQGDRYKKLNMTNISNPARPSICEFRHHGGVEELREAEAWARLLLRFCEKAAQQDTNVETCLLAEVAEPKDELQALFTLVNCEGLEQFFVLERKLFVGQRLSNPWDCRVCRRELHTCRDLA